MKFLKHTPFFSNSDLTWWELQQIAITSSTSAGLDQILPWLYYHRVIGVTDYILFVEGQAASPKSTAVLESIPVRDFYHFSFPKPSACCSCQCSICNWCWKCMTNLEMQLHLLTTEGKYLFDSSIKTISLTCDCTPRTKMEGGSLQGVKVIHRTKELEEKQAKRCNHLTFIDYFLNFWIQIVFRSLIIIIL